MTPRSEPTLRNPRIARVLLLQGSRVAIRCDGQEDRRAVSEFRAQRGISRGATRKSFAAPRLTPRFARSLRSECYPCCERRGFFLSAPWRSGDFPEFLESALHFAGRSLQLRGGIDERARLTTIGLRRFFHDRAKQHPLGGVRPNVWIADAF